MMSKPQTARERLLRARQALQRSEECQGVRSYSQQHLQDGISAGTYEVGSESAFITSAWKMLWQDHYWVAVAGVSDLGWEAISQLGIDLRRAVILECDATHYPTVLATVLEGFEVVIVGDITLSAAQQRVLAARARQLERYILTSHRWPLVSVPFPPFASTTGWRQEA